MTGWSRSGTTIEFYLADADPSGFGEGQTWLISKVEGSADDTDATTSTYGPGLLNGLDQGTDTTSRFSFTIPIASLAAPVTGGDTLTSLATSGTDTSEFGGIVTLPAPFVVNSTGDGSDANAGNGVCETATPGAMHPPGRHPGGQRPRRYRHDPLQHPDQRSAATRHRRWHSPFGRPVCCRRSARRWCSMPAPSRSTQRPTVRSSRSTGPNVSAGEENGFYLTGGGATVRGFVINNCGDDAIDIEFNGGNTIVGNYVGTNVTGTAAAANAWGINFKTGGNIIGGTTQADRNVVSGNTYDGFYIYTAAATGNIVQGNYVGTNAAGTAGRRQRWRGFYLHSGANGNTIGGTARRRPATSSPATPTTVSTWRTSTPTATSSGATTSAPTLPAMPRSPTATGAFRSKAAQTTTSWVDDRRRPQRHLRQRRRRRHHRRRRQSRHRNHRATSCRATTSEWRPTARPRSATTNTVCTSPRSTATPSVETRLEPAT